MRAILQKVWKHRLIRYILTALGVAAFVLLAIGYISLYNQPVILFNGQRLRQMKQEGVVRYEGRYAGEPVQVTVKAGQEGRNIVTYQLPNQLHFEYTVYLNPSSGNAGSVTVWQGEETVFTGKYLQDTPTLLYTDGGEPYFDALRIVVNGEYYTADYIPSAAHTVSFALGNTEKRGNAAAIVLFFILAALLIIDRSFPLFFFRLRTFASVQDAQPSSFYLAMQKFNWFVGFPLLLLGMLVWGIW